MMINLPIVRRSDKRIIKSVIQSKHNPTKARLLQIQNNVLRDYLQYGKNRHSLERIIADTTIDLVAADDLRAAYKKGKEIESVKADIMEAMPPAIRERCPYCMLSEPDTYDHYLGKGAFPEYSVMSKNLVPCCSRCNELKGSKFLDANGNRIFISFYFDRLPKETIFEVQIGLNESGLFVKKMSIKANAGKKIDKIVATHFDKLHLFDRYEYPMANKLSVLISRFEASGQRKEKIVSTIADEIAGLERIYGPNYWECCLYKGVIENDKVLDFLEEKSLTKDA